jgi:hypothetical protein
MTTFVPFKKNLLASLLLIGFHSAFAGDHLVLGIERSGIDTAGFPNMFTTSKGNIFLV